MKVMLFVPFVTTTLQSAAYSKLFQNVFHQLWLEQQHLSAQRNTSTRHISNYFWVSTHSHYDVGGGVVGPCHMQLHHEVIHPCDYTHSHNLRSEKESGATSSPLFIRTVNGKKNPRKGELESWKDRKHGGGGGVAGVRADQRFFTMIAP